MRMTMNCTTYRRIDVLSAEAATRTNLPDSMIHDNSVQLLK